MNTTAEEMRQRYPVGPEVPDGVQICQLAIEFEAVLDLYRHEAPMRVLEIGTASGGTLYHWLANAQPGARIVTVELAHPDYPSSAHLYEQWTPDDVDLHAVTGNSHNPETVDVCRYLGPYQWLFIDGCHVFEEAKQDWDDYRPLVEPGGLVLFHDIALRRRYDDGREAGVHYLWREIQASGLWTREFRADIRLTEYGIGAVRLP